MGCIKHPSRKVVTPLFGGLCEKCAEQVKSEQKNIHRHVEPKECFVSYTGGTLGWKSIPGTGCAHWVAHQLGITAPHINICALGYQFRVPDIISGARKIDRQEEKVEINDIWANSNQNHCGLVSNIEDVKTGEKVIQKITIKHCSSNQGMVAENDFNSHFNGDGNFYRL